MEAAWEAIWQRHHQAEPEKLKERPRANPLRLDPQQPAKPRSSPYRDDLAKQLMRDANDHDAAKPARETLEQRLTRERLQEMLRRRDDGRDREHER